MNDKCDVHYNYLTFIVNIVIISAIFISCRKVNDEQFINRPLSGMLFYNKSSGMYKYDLKERSFQMVIAYPENKMILDDITMINNNKFIVEELVDGLYGISLVDKEIKFFFMQEIRSIKVDTNFISQKLIRLINRYLFQMHLIR